MKIIKLFIILVLLVIVGNSQDKLPIIKSNANVISIQDGDVLKKDNWTLEPEAKPDIYTTSVEKGKKKTVTFITDIDKISFDIEAGKKYDFIIQKGEAMCYTQIVANELLFWSKDEFWNSSSMKTPYKPNLSDEEKIAGLSRFWSEAKYNFINFPLVPDLDWDKTYLEFIPKALATKSTLEYYRVLQMFCSRLKDGHTNVFLPNELADEAFRRPALITQLVENKVIIIRLLDEKLKNEGLAIGQEITEIDGIAVKKYAEENVLPFASESTIQSLDVRIYRYDLLNGPLNKPIELTIKDAKGNSFKKILPRLSAAERNKLATPRPPFEMNMLANNIAHVKVNSMVDEDKADQLFADNYSKIEKADAVILDLRENGGGSSGIGYRILAFLTEKPFKGSAWFTRNYRPAVRAWGQLQEKFGNEAREVSIEEIKKMRGANTKVYDKPVIVLSSPRTFSAAEDFLVAFKPLKRGLIIGEPSGGSTGQPLVFNLPGGGSARVCSKYDTFADGTAFVGIGVVPDILAAPKVSDYVENKDAVLEVALQELAKQMKK